MDDFVKILLLVIAGIILLSLVGYGVWHQTTKKNVGDCAFKGIGNIIITSIPIPGQGIQFQWTGAKTNSGVTYDVSLVDVTTQQIVYSVCRSAKNSILIPFSSLVGSRAYLLKVTPYCGSSTSGTPNTFTFIAPPGLVQKTPINVQPPNSVVDVNIVRNPNGVSNPSVVSVDTGSFYQTSPSFPSYQPPQMVFSPFPTISSYGNNLQNQPQNQNQNQNFPLGGCSMQPLLLGALPAKIQANCNANALGGANDSCISSVGLSTANPSRDNATQCSQLCQYTPSCQSFTFEQDKNGASCSLFKTVPSYTNLIPASASDVLINSGFKQCLFR